MAQVVVNATLEIDKTLGTALTVSALTQADPGVATSTTHGLSNGAVVFFTVTDGMVELHRQACRAANVTTDTFELENVNTTDYSAWVSGTATEVTAFDTLCNTTNVSLGNAPPTEVDLSTYCSKVAQTGFGLPGSASGTIDIFDEPSLAGMQTLEEADSDDLKIFRAVYGNLTKIFSGLTAYGGGFDAPLNGALTGQIPLTVTNRIISYTD